MQAGLDSSLITVPGSRWPILVDAPDAAATRAHTRPTTASYAPSAALTMNSSTARRKPRMTFRSPGADAPLALKLAPSPISTPPQPKTPSTKSLGTPSPNPIHSVRSACSFFTPAPPLFKMPLAYPSYHPFSPGQLLLAAAARADAISRRYNATNSSSSHEDASVHGDDGPLNGAVLNEDAEGRRSSSRTRRPVAKLREIADGDEDGAPESNATARDKDSVKSPKRKRAGGGGGGSRKKRKDAGANAVPAEVQPRRERQRRGAAAAAAAALAENAEAVAAALDAPEALEMDEVETSAMEPAPTPASVDNSIAPGSPEEDSKDAEVPAADDDAIEVKNARPKRQSRPKRSRNAPAKTNRSDTRSKGSKEPTPTRTTRQTRQNGSSGSGSEGVGSRASVPIGDMPSTKTKNQDMDVDQPDAAPKGDDENFTSNIDPALLSEEQNMKPVSARSALTEPRSALT